MGVRKRLGRVTSVSEGRNSSNPHIGKQVTIEDQKIGQPTMEATDLVLWTAGAHPLRYDCVQANALTW